MRADLMLPRRDGMGEIHDLSSVSCSQVENFGGKASNLYRLRQYGFNVPAGFVIPCSFYSEFLQESPSVGEQIEGLDGAIDLEDLMAVTAGFEKTLLSCEVPESIQAKISTAYRKFKESRNSNTSGFAVRSSAVLEDGYQFSFAGQAESYLGANGLEEVLESVKRVWCSALNTRSILYLNSKGIPLSKIKMAVIVQELIPAEVSGVMFTANVVSNDRNQMVIDATYGLGGTIVSGRVIPDNYILKKESLAITEKKRGTKELMIRPCISKKAGNIKEEKTPEHMQERFAVSDEDVVKVARLGKEIERAFEYPQDIEWCMHNREIVVLQSRPITTLR
jgi:pyruvate,water dikinase